MKIMRAPHTVQEGDSFYGPEMKNVQIIPRTSTTDLEKVAWNQSESVIIRSKTGSVLTRNEWSYPVSLETPGLTKPPHTYLTLIIIILYFNTH